MAHDARDMYLPIRKQMQMLHPRKENSMASFSSKTRAQLDEIAQDNNLSPEDYKNKDEVIAALEDAGVEPDSADTTSNASVEPQDAPGATEAANATQDIYRPGNSVFVRNDEFTGFVTIVESKKSGLTVLDPNGVEQDVSYDDIG